MNYKELFITIGLMFSITIIYILLRKIIYWAIEDHDKFCKKKHYCGMDKGDKKAFSDIPIFKLTCGYILFIVLLIIYVFKLIVDSQ